MTIIPMRDLKDTVAVERHCAEANGPVFVTKNGYGKLVVMDIEYYEQTMRRIYEAKQVNEGLSDLANGKTVDGDEVKQKLAAKFGKRENGCRRRRKGEADDEVWHLITHTVLRRKRKRT